MSSNNWSVSFFSAAWSSTLCTPRENEPSGIFTTIGQPSFFSALIRSSLSASITVGGIGTPCASINSCR